MLDLQHLKTFTMVATLLSFSRAADALDYSQSSVTHHIKRLENELGVRLFNRFRFAHTIALTNAGRRIYEYATRLLALAEEAKAAAQSEGTKAAAQPNRRRRSGLQKGVDFKRNLG